MAPISQIKPKRNRWSSALNLHQSAQRKQLIAARHGNCLAMCNPTARAATLSTSVVDPHRSKQECGTARNSRDFLFFELSSKHASLSQASQTGTAVAAHHPQTPYGWRNYFGKRYRSIPSQSRRADERPYGWRARHLERLRDGDAGAKSVAAGP